MRVGLIVLALIFSVSASASDEVYKWTDANGVTHFADAPPQGVTGKVDKIMLRGGVTTSAPATPPPEAEKPEIADPTVDTPENRARICREARANLELLQSNYQLSMPTGEDGASQPIDEETREKELEKAKEQVAFYCRQDN